MYAPWRIQEKMEIILISVGLNHRELGAARIPDEVVIKDRDQFPLRDP